MLGTGVEVAAPAAPTVAVPAGTVVTAAVPVPTPDAMVAATAVGKRPLSTCPPSPRGGDVTPSKSGDAILCVGLLGVVISPITLLTFSGVNELSAARAR